MRFVRHLIAGSLVIASICAVALFVGLGGRPGRPGIFCPHGCDPRSLGLDPADPALRKLAVAAPGRQQMHLDYADLVHTVVLGTAVALLVVALDMALRRRRRRIRADAR